MKRIRAYIRRLTRLSRRAPPGLDCLRPPRYDNPSLTVVRGPVPRHAFGWQTASPL